MATTIRFQLRGDSAENWSSKNPVLLKNEPGYDTTNRRLKLGDGLTAWNDLEYVAPDVINDLLTGGADRALSAEQGIILKELIDTKDGNYKRIIVRAPNSAANLNDNKEPSGRSENIIIPDGVNTIYISGCGAGGGLGVESKRYLCGWDAAYCLSVEFPVNPGDELNVKIGIGGDGQNVFSSNGEIVGSCSRGQDSVVTLNNEEIVRLAGGNGGKNGHAGNQTGQTKFTRASNIPTYVNATYNSFKIPSYIYSSNTGWTYNNDLLYYTGGFKSNITPFAPYGLGGSFSSYNHLLVYCNPIHNTDSVHVPYAYRGTNGLIIIEFGSSIEQIYSS